MNRTNAVGRCALGLLVLGLALGTLAAASAAEEGWLGVMLQPLTGDLSEAMNIGKDVQGVLVNEVVEGSPAEAAGLAKGDVIIEIDGATVTSTDEAIAQVRGHAPGDKVKIVALRDGKREVVTAVLGEREDSGKEAEATKDYYNIKIPRVERIFEKFGGDRGGYLGVTVHDMSAGLSSYFGVREGEGVLVLDVLEDTPAQRAGLRAGDVITKIGGTEVNETGDLLDALRGMKCCEKTDVVFKRNHETRRVEVEVAESPDPVRVFINKAGESDEWAPHGLQSGPCCGMDMRGGMMSCQPGEGGSPIRCKVIRIGDPGKGDKGMQCEMMMSGEPSGGEEMHYKMMQSGQPGAPRQEMKDEMEQLKKEIEHLKQELETLKK